MERMQLSVGSRVFTTRSNDHMARMRRLRFGTKLLDPMAVWWNKSSISSISQRKHGVVERIGRRMRGRNVAQVCQAI
jgi:hypothetical protein